MLLGPCRMCVLAVTRTARALGHVSFPRRFNQTIMSLTCIYRRTSSAQGFIRFFT